MEKDHNHPIIRTRTGNSAHILIQRQNFQKVLSKCRIGQ